MFIFNDPVLSGQQLIPKGGSFIQVRLCYTITRSTVYSIKHFQSLAGIFLVAISKQ